MEVLVLKIRIRPSRDTLKFDTQALFAMRAPHLADSVSYNGVCVLPSHENLQQANIPHQQRIRVTFNEAMAMILVMFDSSQCHRQLTRT